MAESVGKVLAGTGAVYQRSIEVEAHHSNGTAICSHGGGSANSFLIVTSYFAFE